MVQSNANSGLHSSPEYSGLAEDYLQRLLAGDRHGAAELMLSEAKAGTDIKALYLEVFQPVQWELGRLWESNEISVAQEHYCTAATQLVISQLYPWIFSGRRDQGLMVAAAVPGELHELGVRMVADFFEMEGWDSHYLGANVPVGAMVETIARMRPQLLAISASLDQNVPAAAAVIQGVRALPDHEDLVILVGGHPFNAQPDLWRSMGADGHARDAQEAVTLARSLLSSRTSP